MSVAIREVSIEEQASVPRGPKARALDPRHTHAHDRLHLTIVTPCDFAALYLTPAAAHELASALVSWFSEPDPVLPLEPPEPA